MAKDINIGYSRYGLDYQPSMNSLQSNYDMWLKGNELTGDSNKAKTFLGNALNLEENPLALVQLMNIMPNLFALDEGTYMPTVEDDQNFIGMQGAYNLNSINRFKNGGKPKRGKEKAYDKQLQPNKYYSNNY